MTARGDDGDDPAQEDQDTVVDDGLRNLAEILSMVLSELDTNKNSKDAPAVMDLLMEVAGQFEAPRATDPYRATIWLHDLMDSVINQAYEEGKTKHHMEQLLVLRQRLSRLNLHTSALNEFQLDPRVFTELQILGLDLTEMPLDTQTVKNIADRLGHLIDEAHDVLPEGSPVLEEIVSILKQARDAVRNLRSQPKNMVEDQLDLAMARATKVVLDEAERPEQVDLSRRDFIKRFGGGVAMANLAVTGARNAEWVAQKMLPAQEDDTPPIELNVYCAEQEVKELEAGPRPDDTDAEDVDEPLLSESPDSTEPPVADPADPVPSGGSES